MAGLKALVVFMAILIVAGLVLLAYGALGGLTKRSPGGFGTAQVTVPPGCTLAEARVDQGVLVLRVEGPAERGCPQVILMDPDSGRERGRVAIRDAP